MPFIMIGMPLAAVFMCFGLLLMAQYNTHLAKNDALLNESATDLAQIIRSMNDNQAALEAELSQLNSQLAEMQSSANSNESLAANLTAKSHV